MENKLVDVVQGLLNGGAKVMLMVEVKPQVVRVSKRKKQAKHQQSVASVKERMLAGQTAMVVTNTTEANWDKTDYISLAREYGYQAYVVDMKKENPEPVAL